MKSKKKAGLILSGIGEILYFLNGVIYCFLSGPEILPISLLLTGTISLIGTILEKKEIKIGGAVILISIPFSIGVISILNFFLNYMPTFRIYDWFLLILYPIPYPHSVFVIIGGILCVRSSDD